MRAGGPGVSRARPFLMGSARTHRSGLGSGSGVSVAAAGRGVVFDRSAIRGLGRHRRAGRRRRCSPTRWAWLLVRAWFTGTRVADGKRALPSSGAASRSQFSVAPKLRSLREVPRAEAEQEARFLAGRRASAGGSSEALCVEIRMASVRKRGRALVSAVR